MARDGLHTSSTASKSDDKDFARHHHGTHSPGATHLQSFATHTACSSTDAASGVIVPKHGRSKSAPEITFKLLFKNMATQSNQVSSLKQRLKIDRHISKISRLEEERHSAVLVLRGGCNTAMVEAKELVQEISFLEEEIADLEQYVLSLYRNLFNKCVSPSPSILSQKYKSTILDRRKELKSTQDCSPKHSPEGNWPYCDKDNVKAAQITSSRKAASMITSKTRHAPKLCESVKVEQHCQVPIMQTSQQIKAAPEPKIVKSVMPVDAEEGGSPRMLKDYLSESPNQLAEDLVRCMAHVYRKLSISTPASYSTAPESPLSSTSSLTSASSLHGMFSDGWSPASHPDPGTNDLSSVDLFQLKKGFQCTAAFHDVLEIPYICTDKDRLNNVTRMLRTFRSLVEKLERVDPSQLKHNQKLAFWINIHNALVMHASYKVGGQTVNAHTIEHCFLRCNFHRPLQWLQNLLSPSMMLKSSNGRRAFAIDRAEPLVCFALCCGGRSDPAVRLYTSKHVNKELDLSMKEYLQASIGFQNGKKILLPKVLEWYMKEASLPSNYLLDWVAQYVNEKDRESIRLCVHSKSHRSSNHCIEWVPYNCSFRYMLHRDVAFNNTILSDN